MELTFQGPAGRLEAILEEPDAAAGRLRGAAVVCHPHPLHDGTMRNTIVFRSGAGTKLAAAVLGRAVAFEVDGYEVDDGVAWSVVVKGRARQIENMFEFLDAEELPLFPWHIGPKPNLVRIEPDDISGRRFFAAGRVDRDD